MAEEWWRRAGLRRAGREPPREPVFDLLERAPDRAAVLLGMSPSLVAQAPYSPSATLITETSQFGGLGALRCRNDDSPGLIPGSNGPPDLKQGALRRLRRHRDRRIDRDLEPERRLLRQPRRIPARLLERLQGHARLAVAHGRHRVVLPRRRDPDGHRGP